MVGRRELPSLVRKVFLADDAIARFGVGKNMVASIRHWATFAGVISDSEVHAIVGRCEYVRRSTTASAAVGDPILLRRIIQPHGMVW